MSRKLTARTALWKARGLLGEHATASMVKCCVVEDSHHRQHMSCHGVHERPCPGNRPVYRIGRIVLGMFNSIHGEGATWEEAFEKATERKKRGGL